MMALFSTTPKRAESRWTALPIIKHAGLQVSNGAHCSLQAWMLTEQ